MFTKARRQDVNAGIFQESLMAAVNFLHFQSPQYQLFPTLDAVQPE